MTAGVKAFCAFFSSRRRATQHVKWKETPNLKKKVYKNRKRALQPAFSDSDGGLTTNPLHPISL
jgi:hypothetical protein